MTTTNIAAIDIKPGMRYQGREIAVVYQDPDNTVTIAVVCGNERIQGNAGAGKFRFNNNDIVEVSK